MDANSFEEALQVYAIKSTEMGAHLPYENRIQLIEAMVKMNQRALDLEDKEVTNMNVHMFEEALQTYGWKSKSLGADLEYSARKQLIKEMVKLYWPGEKEEENCEIIDKTRARDQDDSVAMSLSKRVKVNQETPPDLGIEHESVEAVINNKDQTPANCRSDSEASASTSRTKECNSMKARDASHREKDGVTIQLDLPEKINCVNLILRLCSKSAFDPMAVLRLFLRGQNISNGEELNCEAAKGKGKNSLIMKLEKLAIVCSEKKQAKGNFFDLLACIALVIEYRTAIRKLKENGYTEKGAEQIANEVIQRHKVQHARRVGNHALVLCWAISPRNMFGVMILSAMSLTKSEIHTMNQATRVAFMMLFTGHWVPNKKEFPEPVCACVTEMVQTILPAAELMLIMNLKDQKVAMSDLTPFSRLITYPTNSDGTHKEEAFGFCVDGMKIYMARPSLVSTDFASRGEYETKASLLKSLLVIEHPALNNVYQGADSHISLSIYNLRRMQERFFHYPIDGIQTPIPSMIYGDYLSESNFVFTPISQSTYQDNVDFEALLHCLKNAMSILNAKKHFRLQTTKYGILCQSYLALFEEEDSDPVYSKTVDLDVWKKEEEESETIYSFL